MTRFSHAGLRSLLPAFLSLTLLACPSNSSWDEVRRVLAPGGGIDAVLAERKGGGRAGFEYDIYVVPNGADALTVRPVAILYEAMRNDSAFGAGLHWIGRDTLSIEYLRAKSEKPLVPEVEILGARIAVRLSPGMRDSLAPAGPMLRTTPRRSR